MLVLEIVMLEYAKDWHESTPTGLCTATSKTTVSSCPSSVHQQKIDSLSEQLERLSDCRHDFHEGDQNSVFVGREILKK